MDDLERALPFEWVTQTASMNAGLAKKITDVCVGDWLWKYSTSPCVTVLLFELEEDRLRAQLTLSL